MDHFIADFLRAYSGYTCKNSQGVRQGRKLCGDLTILRQKLPKLWEEDESIVARDLRDSISKSELLETICDTGVTQAGARLWRRLLLKGKIRMHSEGALKVVQDRRDAVASRVFGAIHRVVGTGKINENGEGHAMNLAPMLAGLARIALHAGAQPEEIEDLEGMVSTPPHHTLATPDPSNPTRHTHHAGTARRTPHSAQPSPISHHPSSQCARRWTKLAQS